MQYYASHYLWHAGQDKLFRMQRIGLEVSGRTLGVDGAFGRRSPEYPVAGRADYSGSFCSGIRKGETFQEFRARTASAVVGDQPLYAFHVSFFDLQKMAFTDRSRLVRL